MLHIRLRISFTERCIESRKPIKHAQQDFLDTTVVEVFEHLAPAVCALLAAYVKAKDLAVTVFVDPHGEINDFSANGAALEFHI
ncbi:hypothetical protein D3C75_1223080 [compost metagenome]